MSRSRSIRRSATSASSSLSRASWSGVGVWSPPPPRRARSFLTQFPSEESYTPSSRATSAIDRSVSITNAAASRLNSSLNLRRFRCLLFSSGTGPSSHPRCPAPGGGPLPALQAQLRESDDPRADAILAALDGRKWDLLAATQAVQDDDTATPTSELNRLRALASQTSPAPLDATDAATALREAVTAHATATATDAGRADRLAAVLRAAVAHVTHDGTQPCPLCGSGTTLDDTWAAQATQEADAAAQAKAVRDADTALGAASTAARRLLPAVPEALHTATFVGLDAQPAIDAWEALLDAPDDPAALADHLEQAVPTLHQAVTALRKEAAATLDQRQSDWRPIAAAVTRWIDDAHAAQAADARAKVAKQAEKWLADTANAIEAERFEPIRDAVQGYWGRLRLQSNVALNDLSLKRSGNRRSLELDVAVDDSDASALGVMSQGELHALALSVFLPRATLDESPFRFLVLDDPVQAMDPAKVEGLAAVLADVAQTRQVIVLTHDTRLPDAVRDLQIPARIVEVHRRARSKVQLTEVTDPVARHLDDARAIARTEDLPPAVRAKLVAQMGRGALEAVSMEVVRRRRLGRGDRHEHVEAALAGSKVHDLVTLALFDDPRRGKDLFPTLNRWARDLADAFADCKRGTHVGERTIDDPTFVRHVGELVERIRREAA